ncbi:hypothetical protein JIN84_03000 [Luteolibacter yonseiensis]|uniref:Uncharacterized protein n=1 Tax=Luteolibacter yonseiensis TaxID=1144680 RepID=A0A934V9W8_9BACT|nr:hypothetical protein [Luteolibacter yonseiensis]MBK1814565.1 hypothetical protein [Luteolibacter yonseiensis]
MKFTKRKRPSGFALVATLMMMLLLVVIAVGLLGLSTIELRKTGNGNAMERARANARMGLMIALGELQKNLGPDQRVSADARMASNGVNDPEHPHWVSVWKSTQKNGKPWITRDAEKGGLSDQRQANGWNARDERLTTLVSGNEGNGDDDGNGGTNKIVHDDDGSGPSADLVALVDVGSLGQGAPDRGNQKADAVYAPLVEVSNEPKSAPSKNNNPSKHRGGYAWWVGDLGTQANVATRDGTPDTTVGQYKALMLAQDSSWKAYKDKGVKMGNKELANEERSKLASDRQLALVQPGMDDRRFHEFNVWSAGLPVNVREGGWKKDLTAFFQSEGSIGDERGEGFTLKGVNDLDNIISSDVASSPSGSGKRLDPLSPKFGLLRTWAKRADDAPFGSYSPKLDDPEFLNLPTGGNSKKSIDYNKRVKSYFMPVLVEGSMYYNLSYYEPTTPKPNAPYGLRLHLYPRVALWNPYNFTMRVPASTIFMHINGAKQVEVTMEGGIKRNYRMFWGLNNGGEKGGATRGSMFFKMDAATLEPGQTLVWSPSKNADYQETDSFGGNTLTTSVAPSPSRAFYMDAHEKANLFTPLQYPKEDLTTAVIVVNRAQSRPIEWREVVPARPAAGANVQEDGYTQADDYLMSWKMSSTDTLLTFQDAKMGRFVSCAYQYGDEDEMPVEWTSLDTVPFAKTSVSNTTISQIPDRRTRDGFRLRWSQETESNLIGSGKLAGTGHLEDSAIGNWNMRASWAFRNPFDNVSNLAPNFFGIYTRDLFDGDVDWNSISPRSSGGKALGDPFDQPVRGVPQRILFDVPRKGTEIASLGALQHVGFSEFIWHPTYALGNSLADPRVPMEHTEPDRSESINKDKGGWNQRSIGYSTDGRSDNNGDETRTNEDNWAYTARNYIHKVPEKQSVIYDLSYELNHNLWDGYFLSSGTNEEKEAFLDAPDKSPLPNGRMRPNKMGGEIPPDHLTVPGLAYHHAASHLLIDGAFNVNSTSVSAWEALLLSGVDKKYGDKVAFPRFLNAPGGDWDGSQAGNVAAWSGQRVFDRGEITKLAEQIVKQVRERGPFISLADFANRRLSKEEDGKKGALQAAIDLSGVNDSFSKEWPLDNTSKLPDFKSIDNIEDSTRMEQTLKPDTTAWGALGFLTQADLLQFIGPALSARSDTFRIRAYGESRDGAGNIAAKCYCEAVVQRSPNYVDISDNTLTPESSLNETNKKFGRRFEIVSFRWLKEEEI